MPVHGHGHDLKFIDMSAWSFYRSLLILYFICILMCSYSCLFGVLNLMI